jgi:hypothetical protein
MFWDPGAGCVGSVQIALDVTGSPVRGPCLYAAGIGLVRQEPSALVAHISFQMICPGALCDLRAVAEQGQRRDES